MHTLGEVVSGVDGVNAESNFVKHLPYLGLTDLGHHFARSLHALDNLGDPIHCLEEFAVQVSLVLGGRDLCPRKQVDLS